MIALLCLPTTVLCSGIVTVWCQGCFARPPMIRRPLKAWGLVPATRRRAWRGWPCKETHPAHKKHHCHRCVRAYWAQHKREAVSAVCITSSTIVGVCVERQRACIDTDPALTRSLHCHRVIYIIITLQAVHAQACPPARRTSPPRSTLPCSHLPPRPPPRSAHCCYPTLGSPSACCWLQRTARRLVLGAGTCPPHASRMDVVDHGCWVLMMQHQRARLHVVNCHQCPHMYSQARPQEGWPSRLYWTLALERPRCRPTWQATTSVWTCGTGTRSFGWAARTCRCGGLWAPRLLARARRAH